MCTRASDGLHVVCCMLYAACCILHLACCILRATRCMPYVGCCTLSVVCWMLYMNMLHCTSLVARCIMPRRIQAHRRVARPPALLSAAPRRSVYHGYHNGYGRQEPNWKRLQVECDSERGLQLSGYQENLKPGWRSVTRVGFSSTATRPKSSSPGR